MLTPTGQLRLVCSESDAPAESGFENKTDQGKIGWSERVAAGFVRSTESGLFRLAASKPELPLPATLHYWRRFAEGYLTELCCRPDHEEVKVYCGLAKQQAELYAATVDQLKEQLASAEGIKRKWLVLSYLMKFKQICNRPQQSRGNGAYNWEASKKFARLHHFSFYH